MQSFENLKSKVRRTFAKSRAHRVDLSKEPSSNINQKSPFESNNPKYRGGKGAPEEWEEDEKKRAAKVEGAIAATGRFPALGKAPLDAITMATDRRFSRPPRSCTHPTRAKLQLPRQSFADIREDREREREEQMPVYCARGVRDSDDFKKRLLCVWCEFLFFFAMHASARLLLIFSRSGVFD